MRVSGLAGGAVLSAMALAFGVAMIGPTSAAASVHRHVVHRGYVRGAVLHVRRYAGYSRFAPFGRPPLAGTVGLTIPPAAARFMGYPYNVPGYRYEYGDACLLRVGGPFGPGPSAGPCSFGLDRAF